MSVDCEKINKRKGKNLNWRLIGALGGAIIYITSMHCIYGCQWSGILNCSNPVFGNKILGFFAFDSEVKFHLLFYLIHFAFSKFIKIMDMQISWKKVFFWYPRWFDFLNPYHREIHPVAKRSSKLKGFELKPGSDLMGAQIQVCLIGGELTCVLTLFILQLNG